MILNSSIVEKNPDSIYAHSNFGNTLLKYGVIPEAKAELSFVLRKPASVNEGALEASVAYFNLGVIYMEEGQYLKAEEMYRQALKFTPHVANIYTKLGFCYDKQGLHEKAQDYFNQAKKINPYFAPDYQETGATYSLMNKYREAKSYWQARENLKRLERVEKGK